MRLKNILFAAALAAFATMLQGCPKESIDAPCALNNIVVRNGIYAAPATDSLHFGDTLWLMASVSRHARDNNNQPIDLDNKGFNSSLTFSKRNMASGEVMQQQDFRIVMLTGTLGETKMSGNYFTARLNYDLVGDSMKLRAGFVPQRKGIYEIKGSENNNPAAASSFSTVFYKNGSCYQGVLHDSFANPSRHWYLLYAGTAFNYPTAYYINFY